MNLRLLSVAAVTLTLSSCSSIGLKQTLDSEVTEMRALRSSLDSGWSAIEQRVASVERDVASFGDVNVDLSGVDAAALERDILEDTNVTIDEAGGVQGETTDIEAIYRDADAETRGEVESMRAEAKRILVELRTGIPADLKALTETSAKAAVDAARIHGTAEQLGSVAEKNPLMTDADMASYRRNRATLDAEMNGLTGFADQVVRDSGELSARLSTALATFEAKVAGLDG